MTSEMFVAAYHDTKGHTVKIDDLIKRVFADTGHYRTRNQSQGRPLCLSEDRPVRIKVSLWTGYRRRT